MIVHMSWVVSPNWNDNRFVRKNRGISKDLVELVEINV